MAVKRVNYESVMPWMDSDGLDKRCEARIYNCRWTLERARLPAVSRLHIRLLFLAHVVQTDFNYQDMRIHVHKQP